MSLLVLAVPATRLSAQWRGCYESQAQKDAELRQVQQNIREWRSKAASDPYTGVARRSGVDLQFLQDGERRIAQTPVCGSASASSSGYYGYDRGDEIGRATAEMAEFARRDAERRDREIEANRQHYSGERDRMQKEFSGLHDDLDRKLQAIEASERGAARESRGRDPQEMQREAEAQAQYNQQRQQLIETLVSQGFTPAVASSGVDSYLNSVAQSSQVDAGLDAAIQDPGSFTPGGAFRDYPTSLETPLGGGTREVPAGALPPVDELDQYDPLMRPNGGTLEELYQQKQAQTQGPAASDPKGRQDLAESPGTGGSADTIGNNSLNSRSGSDVAANQPVDQKLPADPAAPKNDEISSASTDSDVSKPGYAEAVAEMRQQDTAYSAKIEVATPDQSGRTGAVMQGDLSGVGTDSRQRAASAPAVQARTGVAPPTNAPASNEGPSTSYSQTRADPSNHVTSQAGSTSNRNGIYQEPMPTSSSRSLAEVPTAEPAQLSARASGVFAPTAGRDDSSGTVWKPKVTLGSPVGSVSRSSDSVAVKIPLGPARLGMSVGEDSISYSGGVSYGAVEAGYKLKIKPDSETVTLGTLSTYVQANVPAFQAKGLRLQPGITGEQLLGTIGFGAGAGGPMPASDAILQHRARIDFYDTQTGP